MWPVDICGLIGYQCILFSHSTNYVCALKWVYSNKPFFVGFISGFV